MLNNKYLTKTIQNFNNNLFIRKRINLKDTILIVGSPRSGTTWLMEIFSTLPRYTYLFEPLNPIWSPKSFEIGFRSRTYISENTKWPKGEDFLKKTFCGEIAYLPIKDNLIDSIKPGLSINNIIHYIFGNKLIVKSINMNRMLPWIVKHFELKGIFLIVRHPCATIASQLKTGLCGYHSTSPPYSDVYPTKDIVLTEALENNDLDSNIINKLNKIEKIEEILAVAWCLDNYICLSQSKQNTWKLVIYEKLLKDGEKEINYLFESIGIKDIPRSAIRNLKKPSFVTMKEDQDYIKNPNKQLSKWKQYLSEKQITRILKIISYFDIDLYSKDID